MTFTSPQFLVFFLLLCTVNYFVGKGIKKWFLLLGSLVFIAAFGFHSLIAVIVFSSFTFFMAKMMAVAENKTVFYFGLSVNALAIVLFNYFLASGWNLIFSFSAIDFRLDNFLLVIGLSFYNLQHIAYLIDVHKKRISPEKNYVDFLLISVYFPKFISGPVTLYQELKPQVLNPAPSKAMFWQGFNRMLLGFFKKMLIADRLAPSVSSIFDYNDDLPGITIMTGALLFTIQLYFDFSGYCDMAIGVSKMLGIVLPENFDFPLRATSMTIFWRKWHRSLIHFFTTYIFYPVSYKYRRFKKQASAIAIFLTFLSSAIWHGIGFTFMIWALCHMVYLMVELYFRKNSRTPSTNLSKFLSAAMVLLLVSFSNLFFRSTTFDNCRHLLAGLVTTNFFPKEWLVQFVAPIALGGHQADHFNLSITLLMMTLTLIFERKIFSLFNDANFRPVMTFLVLLLIFLFGVIGNGQRFIYMQF